MRSVSPDPLPGRRMQDSRCQNAGRITAIRTRILKFPSRLPVIGPDFRAIRIVGRGGLSEWRVRIGRRRSVTSIFQRWIEAGDHWGRSQRRAAAESGLALSRPAGLSKGRAVSVGVLRLSADGAEPFLIDFEEFSQLGGGDRFAQGAALRGGVFCAVLNSIALNKQRKLHSPVEHQRGKHAR